MNCNYLAFEGIDGSGKTTLINELSAELSKASVDFKIVREPGGTKLSEGIRDLLLSHDFEVNPTAEALLFSASRAQLIQEVVKPSIKNGQVIITDRSAYSSVAYQGVGRGLGYEKVYELNDFALSSYWPEKVVLLDIDPEISLSRQKIADRIGSDKVSFFNKVRDGYLQLAEDFSDKFLVINAEDSKGSNVNFEGDYCLVSVGRKPYTDGLNLSSVGINTNDKGQIEVNDKLQTNIENIYAIGDVIKGPMLAHKAEEEGVLVAEILAKQKPHINYNLIPNVIYTWPEVASVGKTQEQLSSEGIEFKTGQFPMRALGRARASMDIDGFVKILAHKETDEVLGVHMIGARCADLIAEAVVAMEFRASAEDISRMSHAHPTFAEAIKEAALAATEDRALHI